MHEGTAARDERNDRALFLTPLLAVSVVFLARFVGGLAHGQFSLSASAFWAALQSASYGSIWLPLGWALAWTAWRLGFYKAPRPLLSAAFVVALVSLVAIALDNGSLLFAGWNEEAIVVLGSILNLAGFLCVQSGHQHSLPHRNAD